MLPRSTSLPLGLLLLATGACSGADESAARLQALPAWTVTAEPTRVLADDGTAARLFARVLPARLPNGDLLVGEAGSRELRIFRDGALVTRLSRQGDGPGELQDLSRIALRADTIFVLPVPPMSRQVNSFVAGRGFMSRFRLRGPAGTPGVVPAGVLSTGEFVVEEGQGFRILREAPPMRQLLPDSVTVGLFRPGPDDSTGTYRPVGRFVRAVSVAYPVSGLPIPFSTAGFELAGVHHWVASGPILWVAHAASGELLGFDGDGARVVTDTLPLTPRPFDPAALERVRTAALTEAPDAGRRAELEARYDPALRPATMPHFDQVHAGHDGELWVRLYELEPGSTREFLVVSRRGEALARVTLPAALILHQVGADFVLGVQRDADGVETVVEYGLVRR